MARIPGRIPGRERWEVEDKLILSNPNDKTGELSIYAGTSGEKALRIYNASKVLFQIDASYDKIRLLGASDKCIQIGDAGSPGHTLTSNDDFFISGKLEVDGISYFDGAIVSEYYFTTRDNREIIFGTSSDSALDWSLSQATENTLIWGLGDTAKSIIFCDNLDKGQDFDHSAQSNPTLFVHSAVDPDTDHDQWISIQHDTIDGEVKCGKGTMNLGGSTVNFLNSTRTASTVTHDAYVTLEVGGTEYKFMLGS